MRVSVIVAHASKRWGPQRSSWGGVSAADVDPRSFAAIDFPLVPGTPLPKPEPVFPKFVEETE